MRLLPSLDFKPISLGNKSNPFRKGRNFAARLVNCYAEDNGEEGVSPFSVYPSAGFVNFGAQMDDAGIRNALPVGNSLYVVAGRNLYLVDTFGNSDLIGGIPTDGPVYMERNRRSPTQIGIVSDGNFYIVDTNIVTQINDPDLPAPNSLGYHDGYFLFSILDGRWFISALNDGSAVDGLDFTRAESNPDNLLRIIGFEREVVAFGTGSIEWYQNTGNADFPYSRSAARNIGCLAGGTVCAVASDQENALFFVASDHTVRRIQGYTPTTISTNEITDLIRAYVEGGGDLDQMTATSWEDGGRFYYSLSCPDWTREYNTKSGWGDRKSYLQDRWRVGKVVRFGTKLVACDFAKGQLYEMSDDYSEEAGDPLIMDIIPPPVNVSPYRFICDAIRLNCLTGVGLNNDEDQNENPYAVISVSRDNGKTWHGHESVSLGTQDQTQVNPKVYRLGKFDRQGMTLRFRVSAKVMRRFDGAFAAIRQLAA